MPIYALGLCLLSCQQFDRHSQAATTVLTGDAISHKTPFSSSILLPFVRSFARTHTHTHTLPFCLFSAVVVTVVGRPIQPKIEKAFTLTWPTCGNFFFSLFLLVGCQSQFDSSLLICVKYNDLLCVLLMRANVFRIVDVRCTLCVCDVVVCAHGIRCVTSWVSSRGLKSFRRFYSTM